MSDKTIQKEQCYTFLTDKISFETVEFKGRRRYYINGFISTQDIDIDNDLVTDKGMKSLIAQLSERQITTDWDHGVFLTDNNNLLPTGKVVESKLKSKDGKSGAWVKVELNPTWKRFDKDGKVAMTFQELWTSIKDGFTNAFSIAFKPLKVAYKAVDDVQVRLLDDVRLLNVAITGMPVNPGAMIESNSLKSVMLKALKEYKEENNMVEDKKPELKAEEPVAEEPKKEEAKEDPVETKAEEKVEEAPAEEKPAEEEPAEDDGAEVKSLKEEFTKEMKSMREALEKQEKELKSLKDKSVFKAKAPQEPDTKSKEAEEPTSVMGAIQ